MLTMANMKESNHKKVSWFEFLLNENLLEEHLAQVNPDPSASDLISIFLHQAEIAVNTAREIAQKEQMQNSELKGEAEPIQTLDQKLLPVDSKKAHALRLLAIRVVAYLEWNLELLEKSVPLPTSHEVLNELVGITTPGDLTKTPHAQLNLSTLPDQMMFALQLYYRWWVRAVIRESFCSKPNKVSNVQVPGLLDTAVTPAGSKETAQMLVEGMDEAIKMLDRLTQASRAVIMPVVQSFGMLNENVSMVSHDWKNGEPLSASEIRCQMCYDMASAHFWKGNLEEAKSLFNEARDLLQNIKFSRFCRVDKDRLRGYCAACDIDAGSKSTDLHTRLEASRQQNFKDIVQLLQEDNHKKEVSLLYRLSLEKAVEDSNLPGHMLFEVCACNLVRRLQEGQTVPATFLHSLKNANSDSLLFFFKVCEDAMKEGSFSGKKGVKDFLRYLCQMMPDNRLVQEQLSQYFNMEEWEELARLQSQSQVKWLNTNSSSKSTDREIKLGVMERKLLLTYDPSEIKSLLNQLKERMDRKAIISLSEKIFIQWKLPRDMNTGLDSVKEPERTLAHVLIAKAKICHSLKLYEKVRELLLKADCLVKESSYSLSRLIRWEVLLVDIFQHRHHGMISSGQSLKDLAKKAKSCITSLQLDQDIHPRYEVVANCSTFLLTTKDWDYLISIDSNNNGALQLSQLIAALCKEPQIKAARIAARDLWEAVAMIFTMTQQQKRASSGNAVVVHRQVGMGMMSQQDFLQFITLLQDPVAVSAVLSCLTRLYFLLKDDLTCEVSSEYQILWPSALGSAGMMNVAAVSEAMKCVMEHALTVDPTHPSWLRTKADIHFGQKQYGQALKSYLEAGAVATYFFSEPVPKEVFDDTVYKRMIKCCSYQHCYMQVAVLCQFLEDVDYTTAFKSLLERSSHDAMDAYYDCIWDSTILEFIINLHTRRGENDKKQHAVNIIGQLELNSSNPTEILMEAAKIRKTRFLRGMGKQYL